MYSVKRYIPINFTYIAIVAMYFMSFFSTDLFNYVPFRYSCMVVVGIYIVCNFKHISTQFMGFETVLFVIYYGWSLYSSYLNVGDVVTTKPILSALLTAVVSTEGYLLLIIISNQGLIRRFTRILFNYSFVIMCMNDLLIIVGATSGNDNLIGDKFAVSYFHILVLALYAFEYKLYQKSAYKDMIGLFILSVESLFIILKCGCATGSVGFVLLVLLIIIHQKRETLINTRVVVPFATAACMLFPFWYNIILSNPYVIYFVEGVLHRKISLTGRTYIYEAIVYLMGEGWKIGYGIGTNYEICMRLGFVNIQNGLLKVLMESGLVGVIAVIALIFYTFAKAHKAQRELIVFASYILVFIILSSIEITINRKFVFWMLFILVYSKINREEKIRECES